MGKVLFIIILQALEIEISLLNFKSSEQLHYSHEVFVCHSIEVENSLAITVKEHTLVIMIILQIQLYLRSVITVRTGSVYIITKHHICFQA